MSGDQFDWMREYDGTRTRAAVERYVSLWDSRLDLTGDDAHLVSQAADWVWLAVCIAFKFSLKNSAPNAPGAFEVSKERVEHVNGRFSQTASRSLSLEDMAAEVYDYA